MTTTPPTTREIADRLEANIARRRKVADALHQMTETELDPDVAAALLEASRRQVESEKLDLLHLKDLHAWAEREAKS